MPAIGFGIPTNGFKRMFFDRKAVTNAADRATITVLARFGAYVRTAASTSIRPRKKVSDPGKPPSSHTGWLRDGIRFGYDARHRSVVIGPVRLNQAFFQGHHARPGLVPEVLEYGGDIGILETTRYGSWQRRDLRYRGAVAAAGALRLSGGAERVIQTDRGPERVRRRTVHVRPRPFMHPAFDRELAKHMPQMWKNSIRKAV